MHIARILPVVLREAVFKLDDDEYLGNVTNRGCGGDLKEKILCIYVHILYSNLYPYPNASAYNSPVHNPSTNNSYVYI